MNDAASMDDAIVRVTGARKRFGAVTALDGLNLTVRPGESYGLLGPNGSGKTTLIRAIAGVVRLDAGSVEALGRTMPDRAAAAGIGYMTQLPAVYDDLSVRENVAFFARLYGLPPGTALRRRVDAVLELVQLAKRQADPVRTLSGGMRQRANLACALVHGPRLLLLDEPTVGVDPELRQGLWEHFARLSAGGATLIISTHVMDEARRCGRIGLLRDGRLLAEGAPGELLAAAGAGDLEAAYLHYARRADRVRDAIAAGGAGAMNRVLALAGRIIRQFLRDHRTLALVLLAPTAVMALLGYLVAGEREPAPVGIVQADTGLVLPAGPVVNLGEGLAERLAAQPGISARRIAPDEADAALDAGTLAAVVWIPEGLSAELALAGAPARLHRPEVVVEFEGTQPALAGQVQAAVQESLQALLGEVAALAAAASAHAAPTTPGGGFLEVRAAWRHGGPGVPAMDHYAPVFIVAFVFFFVFLLTSVAFLRERSAGTLERLAASPTTRLEVVLGYLLGFLAFAAVQAAVILGYSVGVLGVSVRGSWAAVAAIEALLVLGSINLGIFLSFFARSELQVVQFIPLVVTSQVLLAGVIWPVETLAPWLRWLAAAMPLKYALHALRAVMLKGQGLAHIWADLAFLAGFALVMAALAAVSLRRQAA